MRTGDAGFFDAGPGTCKIVDRAKDVGRLSTAVVRAEIIENKLKFYPNINEAVALGDRRDDVTVMLNIELAAVGNWAERNNVSYAELSGTGGPSGSRTSSSARHVEAVNRR